MSDTTYKRKEYTIDPEGDVAKALDALNSHITQNKPKVYGSEGAPAPWLAELSTVYDQIKTKTNKPFTYDFNGDALYQQYKDKYTQQAKMAMQDTMGQAAAMTGGYGNSYAATVGNQAYQATMQNLNDVIPELYQLAYDKHKNEVQELYNRYSLVSDRESKDYRNYRDGVIDYYSELDYLTGRYDSILGFDYGKHVDKENWAYDEHRDAVGDKQWLDNFNEVIRQFNENLQFNKDRAHKEDEHWNQEFELKKNNNNSVKDDDWSPDDTGDDIVDDYFANFDAGDWESYFAQIRQSEGKSAAEAELNELAGKGIIPTNFIAMAAVGARGSGGGH